MESIATTLKINFNKEFDMENVMKKIMQNIEVKVGQVYNEAKSKHTTSTEAADAPFDPRKLLTPVELSNHH